MSFSSPLLGTPWCIFFFYPKAPPGFQQQSQEEDHTDRLKDYADLQRNLEVFCWLSRYGMLNGV